MTKVRMAEAIGFWICHTKMVGFFKSKHLLIGKYIGEQIKEIG